MKEDSKQIFQVLIFWSMGIVIYFSLIAQILPNPDAIWNSVIYKVDGQWETCLGRYMIDILQKLRGGVVNTAFVTFISLFWLACICVLIIRIFHIKNIYFQIIVGILIIVSPAVQGVLTYYYCSDFYMFAYFLSVLAVYLMTNNKTIIGYVCSSVCICMSLAIYQAFFSVSITLCLFYVIILLLEQKKSIKKIGYKCIVMLTTGIVGVFVYLYTNRFFLWIRKLELDENRDFSSMGRIKWGMLLGQLKRCYTNLIRYFFCDDFINNSYGIIPRKFINFAFIFFLGFSILYIIKIISNPIIEKVYIIVLLGCIPIAVMSITIFAPKVSIYDSTGVIMLQPIIYIYILPLILFAQILEKKKGFRIAKSGCYLISILIIIMLGNMALGGQVYLEYCMRKTNYIAYAIGNKAEEERAKNGSTIICIIGNFEDGNYPNQYNNLKESIQWTTASNGTIWKDPNGTRNVWAMYLREFLGLPYHVCTQEQYQKIITTSEYMNMGNFPSENSVATINGIIVVKLSDVQE